jgi:hypothetical protein
VSHRKVCRFFGQQCGLFVPWGQVTLVKFWIELNFGEWPNPCHQHHRVGVHVYSSGGMMEVMQHSAVLINH